MPIQDMKAYKREWRARRKAAGLCVDCSNPAVDGVHCPGCRRRQAAYYARRGRENYLQRAGRLSGAAAEERRRWDAGGLCTWCGEARDVPGRKRCRECNQYSRQKLKQYRDSRKAAGLCPVCKADSPAGTRCARCLAEARKHYRAAQRRDPQKFRNKYYRRRMLLRQDGEMTNAQWEELKTLYDYTCLRCRRREPDVLLTVDHVIPLSLGGGSSVANVQPLCDPCNKSKYVASTDYRKLT